MKNEPLTTKERTVMLDSLRAIRPSLPDQIWPAEGMELVWDGDTRANGMEAMASFDLFNPDQITLAEFGRQTPELLVPVLCHELHHKWQWETYGPLVYMLRAVFRRWLLEPSAYRIQAEAEKLMEARA